MRSRRRGTHCWLLLLQLLLTRLLPLPGRCLLVVVVVVVLVALLQLLSLLLEGGELVAGELVEDGLATGGLVAGFCC